MGPLNCGDRYRSARRRASRSAPARHRPVPALTDSLEARVLLSTAMPAFDAAEPTGSMAYRSTAFGTAAAGAEAGRYTFSAAAGQKLAVAVEPLTSPGLD